MKLSRSSFGRCILGTKRGRTEAVGVKGAGFEANLDAVLFGCSVLGFGGDEEVLGVVLAAKIGPRSPGLGLLEDAVGKFNFDDFANSHGGVEFDEIDFGLVLAGLPAGVVEILVRVVKALGEDAGFDGAAEVFTGRGDGGEEAGAQGRVGKVDFIGSLALKTFRRLIDSHDGSDQEGGFEVFQIASKGGLCDGGVFGEIVQGKLVGRIESEHGEEAIEFSHIANAIETGEVAEEDFVDDVRPHVAGSVFFGIC